MGDVMPTEERLELHEERLNKQDERFNQQDERITQLEKHEKDTHRRLKETEENYKKLENTIVTENKEMRLFFQSSMDKQWDLIKTRDEQRHETKQMEHDMAKTKFEKWSDIILKMAGTGGIIYLIVQTILSSF